MSETAIQAEHVSKLYHIGKRRTYRTARETVMNLLGAPARLFRKKPEDPTTELWALRDVSFNVNRGEVVGIIGRNGAGKSTLLKVLSRITEPVGGRITLRGRVGSLLEVGTGFHPELTGRENIFLNGAILGMRRAEIQRDFDAIVDFSEVEQFLDTPVKHYSSGMYMRLAFAVAAHLEPEILIVDEVLAVGDAAFQKKCLGKMQDVGKQGRTVLFVSHNMPAIAALCSRVIVLSAGTVAYDGPAAEGIDRYLALAEKASEVSLRDRVDREGQGKVRFTGLAMEDESGNRLSAAPSGRPIVVAMDYESKNTSPLAGVRASLLFSDHNGQALFLCSTELTTEHSITVPASGTLRVKVPKLPLSGGEYSLACFIEVGGEIQDYVTNAAVIHVEDGDFFGTGKLYPPGWRGKGVLVPHSWILPPA